MRLLLRRFLVSVAVAVTVALPATAATLGEDPPLPLPTVPGAAGPYADSYQGWPLYPTEIAHPIRSVLGDIRPPGVWHTGVDIYVPDDRPEPGASRDHSHRVYAVEGGVVSYDPNLIHHFCGSRSERIGHFGYGHVDPFGVVKNGQVVKPGQMIGWSCRGHWHVHLSEYAVENGKLVLVNPLRPGGKLIGYTDMVRPTVKTIAFYVPAWTIFGHPNSVMALTSTGSQITTGSLSGTVDVRVQAYDGQSEVGWMHTARYRRLQTNTAPYSLAFTLRNSQGVVVEQHVIYRNDEIGSGAATDPQHIGLTNLFAAGTRQPLPAGACMKQPKAACPGTVWYHVFASPDWSTAAPFLDTTQFPNGTYTLTVTASDVAGNTGSNSVRFAIANS